MHAMNHAATALVIHKHYDRVSLGWLLGSAQLMEAVWVALNWLGIEYIAVAPEVRTIADVSLAHMPYSHSVATGVALAGLAWFALAKLARRPALAAPVARVWAAYTTTDGWRSWVAPVADVIAGRTEPVAVFTPTTTSSPASMRFWASYADRWISRWTNPRSIAAAAPPISSMRAM